ncbi:hypothetical protein CF327_g4975 [Tilletia walkeri]|nr:hypothetical protein CF327_g4975 [Tilletia walkeri]
MAPKKSTSKSSTKTANSSGSTSTSSSSRKSGRKPSQNDHDEDADGGGRGIAPRHSRAPLPASTGSIQRPSTEARFEDLFPDSEDQVAPPPAESSSSKRKAPASSSASGEGSNAKRKRTEPSGGRADERAESGRASTSRSKAQSSRAPRATLNEEADDDFVFTRVDPPVASSSRAEPSTKRNGTSSSRRSNHATGSTSAAASTSVSRPLLSDVVEGETPVIRRNQAFRTGAPATPAQRREDASTTKDQQTSRSRKSKRVEPGSSLRQTLGIGQPSSGGNQSGGSPSRRSSLTAKSARRRSSLRDGRTPAYPHRDVPSNELYRHVNAQAGPLPRLKAIFGWILERGVEDGSKGALEPTRVPELPDPILPPPPPEENKKGKRKGKISSAHLGPARPPPQPVLNDADRAELGATASAPAVQFRTVLSAILSKTVADLSSPASSIPNLNWITRPQAGRGSSSAAASSSQTSKVAHPRNLAHAAMIARLEGSLVGLQAELEGWDGMSEDVERMERENEKLEARLEALRSGKDEVEAEAEDDEVASRKTVAGDSKGKGPATNGVFPLESLLSGQEEDWVLSELDEVQRERYLFALSVLRRQPGAEEEGNDEGGLEDDGQRTPRRSKGQASGPSPGKRKGKRKRTGEDTDMEDEDSEARKGADVKVELRNAIADAEWKIDRLRSSTHTLTQLDAISARYMQAISLRLGDALKEITSDAPGVGLAASTEAGGSDAQSGGLGALLRGVRTTSAAAADGTLGGVGQRGAAPGEDPGQDLLRSFVSASGGGRSSRRSAAPPTPRKSTSAAASNTAVSGSNEPVASSSSWTSRRSAAARPSSSAAGNAAGDKSVGNVTATTLPPTSPRPSRLPRPTGGSTSTAANTLP